MLWWCGHGDFCYRPIRSDRNQVTAQHHLRTSLLGNRRLVEVVELHPKVHFTNTFVGFWCLDDTAAEVLRQEDPSGEVVDLSAALEHSGQGRPKGAFLLPGFVYQSLPRPEPLLEWDCR